MLIFIKDKLSHDPIVDVDSNNSYLSTIQGAIEEYIHENKQKTIQQGQPLQAFYISGMAKHHHNNLSNYLNQTVLKSLNEKAIVEQGKFANYPISHYWIRLNDLIIDLTIKQFFNKDLGLIDSLVQYLNSSYFVSNNKSNPIYQLYKN